MFFRKKNRIEELETEVLICKKKMAELADLNIVLRKSYEAAISDDKANSTFCINCVHGITNPYYGTECELKCQCNDFKRKAE